jgi:cysteine desulfurase
VLEAVLPFLERHFGNASSTTHGFGWQAADAVTAARAEVARLIGAKEREIVFTSGATEANNLALKGVAEASGRPGGRIITCATEHPSVLDCCASLEKRGFEIVVLPVDRYGMLDPAELRAALSEDTLLISVMAANNELGTIQSLVEIGEVAREFAVPWHCDGAQAVGKIPLDVDALGIDLLSISAHKLYAPKGEGALYVRSNRRPRLRLAAQLEGGGQERGMRSGTINVPGAVGLGKGSEIARLEMAAEAARLRTLREVLQRKLEAAGTAVANGHPERRLPGCLSLRFVDVDSGRLMNGLRDRVAFSSGSACKSGRAGPSHVLKAVGLDDTAAAETVRFGIGRFTTEGEIESAVDFILSAIAKERKSVAAA